MEPLQPPQEATDIFSLTDQVLSEQYQFIKEIGFGNWGSVWLCSPKFQSDENENGEPVKHVKVAAKLVHRSKTSTTAARVRSLWNEMKIVRSFKDDPHPSIIPFHSFIITPSYALITMDYLPRLIPVEVEESRAKDWFRSLLSAVVFLHKRGVVHNDIKPANILLSHAHVPVLVDFGFAEKHDHNASKPFISNLCYGTPEYLSPERARGLWHDTRKSDVWSLGITFFEVLIGRTPFEYEEGEEFSTKEDLERYWARTLRGKWVGTWKVSKGVEKLLRRMIAPNADLRCTAIEAMADSYWSQTNKKDTHSPPKKVALHSASPSMAFDEDLSRLVDSVPPWSPVRIFKDKRDKKEPHKKDGFLGHARLQSQARSKATSSAQPKAQAQAKRRVAVPVLINPFSPVNGLSPTTAGKENATRINPVIAPTRKPTAVTRKPVPGLPLDPAQDNRKSRILSDLTSLNRNVDATSNGAILVNGPGKKVSRATERVMEWEREKERLREMERLRERESDMELQMALVDEELDAYNEERTMSGIVARVLSTPPAEKYLIRKNSSSEAPADLSFQDNLPVPQAESSMYSLKQSLKLSIEKTMRLYKSSTIGQAKKNSSHSLNTSVEGGDAMETRISISRRQSWEDDSLVRDAKSSLPVVRQAKRNERLAADHKVDRMTIWINNVEKVVEDARRSFASTSPTTLPPLPPAPVSRSASQTRTMRQRVTRKVLAADQIFQDLDRESTEWCSASMVQHSTTANITGNSPNGTLPTIPSEVSPLPGVSTTPRRRRATLLSRSPEPLDARSGLDLDIDSGSPSRRKEKSKSQGLLRPISPISKLQLEVERQSMPSPPVRLSAVLDRSLFIAKPSAILLQKPSVPDITEEHSSEMMSSPRTPTSKIPLPKAASGGSSPAGVPSPRTQRRIETVYDQFLASTSGVKRLGRGYQSDNAGPVAHTAETGGLISKRHSRFFHSARRTMAPPVSSDDQRRAVSVDELGVVTCGSSPLNTRQRDNTKTTARVVRRALMAIVTGKSVTQRSSKAF